MRYRTVSETAALKAQETKQYISARLQYGPSTSAAVSIFMCHAKPVKAAHISDSCGGRKVGWAIRVRTARARNEGGNACDAHSSPGWL